MSLRQLLITLLLVSVGVAIVGGRITLIHHKEMDLRDIREHPENYLGETEAVFIVLNVTQIEEGYYLIHIKDSFDYKTTFVVSNDDYLKYAAYIGKEARFKLVGTIGPGYVHPADYPLTNILVMKPVDSSHTEYYIVYITLSDRESV